MRTSYLRKRLDESQPVLMQRRVIHNQINIQTPSSSRSYFPHLAHDLRLQLQPKWLPLEPGQIIFLVGDVLVQVRSKGLCGGAHKLKRGLFVRRAFARIAQRGKRLMDGVHVSMVTLMLVAGRVQRGRIGPSGGDGWKQHQILVTSVLLESDFNHLEQTAVSVQLCGKIRAFQ